MPRNEDEDDKLEKIITKNWYHDVGSKAHNTPLCTDNINLSNYGNGQIMDGLSRSL